MAIISASSPAAMNAPSSAIQEVAIVVATDRVKVLFADARGLQADALEICLGALWSLLPRSSGEFEST